MKILIITSSYPSTPYDSINAGVFVRDFAKGLMEGGHSVKVLTPRKEKGNYDDEVDVRYFWWLGRETSLTYLNLRDPVDIIKALSLFISGIANGLYFCAKKRYDHIVCMWAVPSGVIAYILNIFTRIPYSVWALGSDIWEFSKSRAGRVLLRIILKNAERVFADGFTLKREVERISGRECSFLPSSRKLLPPQKIDLPQDKMKFLFIGRFHPNKGPDILLEGINLLPEEVKKKSIFYIFGDGPMRKKLENLVEEMGLENCVEMKGYADPLTASSYLHSCDALIIPSRIESIPVILSDAAQAGIPVIATDAGDMGEIVHKYNCGIIVKPHPESIRDGIVKFINEKRDFKEGLLNLKKDFETKKSIQKFLEEIS